MMTTAKMEIKEKNVDKTTTNFVSADIFLQAEKLLQTD